MAAVVKAISLYKDACAMPSLLSGIVTPGISCSSGVKSYTISSCWSQRDLQRMKNIKSFRQHQVLVNNEGGPSSINCVGFPTEQNAELLRRYSPTGKHIAIVRNVTDKTGVDKQYIEIWNCSRKVLTVDVVACDVHGKIYEDEQFGCLEWSSCENKLLYVAEKKQPKSSSYFDSKKEVDPENCRKGDEFVFLDDWGEQLVGRHVPSLYVLHIDSGSIEPVQGVPDGISAGQGLWAPNDEDIIFVGWNNDPYRLGLKFCPIRRCRLYFLKVQDGNHDILSEANYAVSNARLSWDMSKLVYLRNTEGGPHMQCSQLIMYNWNTRKSEIVVNIKNSPVKSEFPGLYLTNLPYRCWSSDNIKIYTHSIWRSCREIIEINLETKAVKKVTSFNNGGDEWCKFGAWTVLDVKDDLILATCAAPNIPQRLVIGKTNEGQDGILWKYLDDHHQQFSDFHFRIQSFSPKMNDTFDYEAILLTPTNDQEEEKPPLIACPHGGPHSAFVADFMLYPAVFCRLGFAVLLINYRGSIGFGNDFIKCLLGNVGCIDVSDCKQAIDEIIDEGIVNGNNVFLQGGSHGGFLVCHLIGQYPDAFRACVARNPVTNMATKTGGTDIPDWSYIECDLGEFIHSRVPSPEAYSTLFKKSPLSNVHKVKTPTMIMIGSGDKRVPPQQGFKYAKALKAHNVKTRVLNYQDDNHSLSKTNHEADAFINIYKWFIDQM